MQTTKHQSLFALLFAVGLCTACDEDDAKNRQEACTPGTSNGCAATEVCEETTGAAPACFAPIRIEGRVTDALSGDAVAGALVVARDANGAAVSGTAMTDEDGGYSLSVPVKRDASGAPVAGVSYTLRADGSGYQSFPVAPRIALPVNVSDANDGVISTSATNINLLPLQDTDGLGTITGRIALDDPKGALVVAGAMTALVATDGTYTLFNVPAGTVTVTAYRQGVNLDSMSVTVTADETTADVVLSVVSDTAASVSGKVEVVNPGAGSDTSVILVVADTFVENTARGEAPPGLRAGGVSNAFTIEGVPDGEYVVLAAFENDYLVRDPDTCIGGTDIVRVTVAGSDVAIEESFKVTGALDVVSPDVESLVTGTPTFVWADDSSEDSYAVQVYDAYGTLVWEDNAIAAVTGNEDVTVAYSGPALESGMVYQFRATSSKDGCELSRTEDLRGVFTMQ